MTARELRKRSRLSRYGRRAAFNDVWMTTALVLLVVGHLNHDLTLTIPGCLLLAGWWRENG